jgi:hypothetical protein
MLFDQVLPGFDGRKAAKKPAFAANSTRLMRYRALHMGFTGQAGFAGSLNSNCQLLK